VAAILLVEDDPSVREAVAMALEGDGHRVTTAATGDEAVEGWRQRRRRVSRALAPPPAGPGPPRRHAPGP
jgi:two-component system, OmpR family, response regulator MtrA